MTAERSEKPYSLIPSLEPTPNLSVYRNQLGEPMAKLTDNAFQLFQNIFKGSDIEAVLTLSEIFHILNNLQNSELSLPSWTTVIAPNFIWSIPPSATIFRDYNDIHNVEKQIARIGKRNMNDSGSDMAVIDLVNSLPQDSFNSRNFRHDTFQPQSSRIDLNITTNDMRTYCYLVIDFEVGNGGKLYTALPQIVVYKRLGDDTADNYLQKFLN